SSDEYQWHIYAGPHAHESVSHPHELKATPLPLKPQVLPPAADGDGGGSGGGTFLLTEPSLDQEIVDLRQSNILLDDDYASVGPTTVPLQALDTWPVFSSMLIEAQKAVPVDLLPEDGTSKSVLEFVNNRDADPVASQAEDSPYTVSSGK